MHISFKELYHVAQHLNQDTRLGVETTNSDWFVGDFKKENIFIEAVLHEMSHMLTLFPKNDIRRMSCSMQDISERFKMMAMSSQPSLGTSSSDRYECIGIAVELKVLEAMPFDILHWTPNKTFKDIRSIAWSTSWRTMDELEWEAFIMEQVLNNSDVAWATDYILSRINYFHHKPKV